ncbi:MAG: hypothetical protein AB7V42_10350 [Thermoleophilia bacterium]
MFPNAFRRPGRVAALLVLLALVGAGVWLYQRAGNSTPASEEEAVREFRAQAGDVPRERGVPEPGVYSFRQEGRESGGIGPASVSRDLPGRAVYVVRLVPGGYEEDLEISEQHIESVRFLMRPAGARAVSRRTKVTFLGIGRDQTDRQRPPPLVTPRSLPVGRAWRQDYRAGDLPVSVLSRVTEAQTMELGGRRYAVRVIRTVARTGGSHPGTRTDTLWWSPALAMPLRWDIDMRITGVARLDTRASLRLESAAPRV